MLHFPQHDITAAFISLQGNFLRLSFATEDIKETFPQAEYKADRCIIGGAPLCFRPDLQILFVPAVVFAQTLDHHKDV